MCAHSISEFSRTAEFLRTATSWREQSFHFWHLRHDDQVLRVSSWQRANCRCHLFFVRLVFSSFRSSVVCWESAMERKRLMVYDTVFNLKVGAYAQEHNRQSAGRNFGFDEKWVHWWLKRKEELATTNKSRKVFCGKVCEFGKFLVEKIGPSGLVLCNGRTSSKSWKKVGALCESIRYCVLNATIH